jgi:hypothetical protein
VEGKTNRLPSSSSETAKYLGSYSRNDAIFAGFRVSVAENSNFWSFKKKKKKKRVNVRKTQNLIFSLKNSPCAIRLGTCALMCGGVGELTGSTPKSSSALVPGHRNDTESGTGILSL